MYDRESGAGILQYMFQRRALQRRIDRHIDRTEIIGGEHDPQRERAGQQHQYDMIVLADAKLVQIAGKACDLLQHLRKSPALAALEGREYLVRLGPGMAFERITQDANISRISASRHIAG